MTCINFANIFVVSAKNLIAKDKLLCMNARLLRNVIRKILSTRRF